MPWFYYSGNVPRSITVKDGLSVAMRPHCKVEIFDVNLPEVRALRKKGNLRVTSKPKNAKSIKDLPSTTGDDIKKVMEKSKLAKFIAEKGVTSKSGGQPKSRNPEMTEGEKTVAAKNKAVDSKPEKSEDSNPSVEAGDKDAVNVEVLSDADSGPDEDGDKKKSKKGRGRKG